MKTCVIKWFLFTPVVPLIIFSSLMNKKTICFNLFANILAGNDQIFNILVRTPHMTIWTKLILSQ